MAHRRPDSLPTLVRPVHGGAADHEQRRRRALEVLEQLTPRRWRDGELPETEEVDRLLERVSERIQRVMNRCAAVDVFVAAQTDVSSTTDDVEAVYAELQLFCRWFAHLADDGRHAERPRAYFQHLRRVAEQLIDGEKRLARQLNQWLEFLQSRQGGDSALRLLLTQASAWHAYVHQELELRRRAIERRVAGARDTDEPAEDDDAELRRRAEALASAGELDLLSAFGACVRFGRERLALLVRDAGTEDGVGRGLVRALWSAVDLVLAEERRAGVEERLSLFDELARDAELGGHFRELSTLLAEPDPDLDPEALAARFDAEGEDLWKVWRALVMAHGEAPVRARAAKRAPLDALWQVLAYPGSPLRALYAVAEEVARRGDDDLRKVLYDCVKSRIFAATAEVAGDDELTELEPFVVLFFRFNFFIQTRYFEQLETMLHLFRSQARRFGFEVDSFDRQWRRLEVDRHRAGDPEATDPVNIGRLPLPVQRHLAREGSYPTYFACHPNHLIAREVVSYLHADNLGRYLKLPDLNRQMFEEAVRRLDLGGRRELVLEVLTHPKCPMIFVGRHLPQLRRDELHRVIQSRSTHSEVKRKAMLLMIQKKGGAKKP